MEEEQKKKRKRDGVWEHVGGEDDEGRCWCRHCPTEWKFSITQKVATVRAHFGVNDNGLRIAGQSGKCRNNPYAPATLNTPIVSHLVAAMTPALQKQFQSELACTSPGHPL